MQRLINIQQKLKAPKGQRNDFGGYKYRSCEDILESVKPLLKEENLVIVMKDDIINLEDRFYIKASAMLIDEEGKVLAQTSAFAREELSKKGMDASQITGSASSYARKYALNGLFAIDDTKDADTMDNRAEPELDKNLVKQIDKCQTLEELTKIYNLNKDKIQECLVQKFNQLIKDKKGEFKCK